MELTEWVCNVCRRSRSMTSCRTLCSSSVRLMLSY